MSNQINQNIREAIDGVVISNYFLSKDEFKNFFEKALDNNKDNPLNLWRKSLKVELDFLINNYDWLIATVPMRAYTIWENITMKYFNNTPVSILAGTNLEQSTNNIKVYANTIESFVLTETYNNELQTSRDKLKIGIQNSTNGNITNDVANAILKDHYQEMAKTIMKEKPYNYEIDEALKNKQIPRISRRKLHIARKAPKEKRYLFYKQVFGKENYGQIWEAYIHHLAHWHGWYLTIRQLNTITNMSARQEEKPNFLNLLYSANNNISFTRGGDVIIVDNNKRVITNVQIKGTQGNPTKFGNTISTNTTLDKYLTPLRDLLNKNSLNEKEIETLYDALKNEAWIEKNDDKVVQKVGMDQLFQEISNNFTKNKGKVVWRGQDF